MVIAEYEMKNSISYLDPVLWKLFSKYTRSKDADWRGQVACFTCGKIDDWRLQDAGHYIPKAISGSYLKFYEKNVHSQCQNCNRLLGGNYQVYKERLTVKYGQGIIQDRSYAVDNQVLSKIKVKQAVSLFRHGAEALAAHRRYEQANRLFYFSTA